MKKQLLRVAAFLFFCMLIILPCREACAAKAKIKSVDPIYQTSTRVTGKATANCVLKLRLDGVTYRAKSTKKGTFTFKNVQKADVGQKAVLIIYQKGKAAGKKTLQVKGSYAFKVTGYDTLNRTVTGYGTAGKKVRLTIGKKTYTTKVKNDGTWTKKISALKKNTKIRASQQKSGKTYSKAKTTTLKVTAFDVSLLKKGKSFRQYCSENYGKGTGSWVSFAPTAIIGNKMYFEYTVCLMENGTGTPKTMTGTGKVTGKNTMYFEYSKGLSGTFTWEDAKTLRVNAVDAVFGYGERTEMLTAQ